MPSVTELLSRKKKDIKQPPLPPIGHYRLKVYRKHVLRTSKDGAWSFLEIYCQALAAQEDVDEEELKEFDRPIESIRVRKTFIYNNAGDPEAEAGNEDTDWRCQEFLNCIGVDGDDKETTMEQLARIENLEFIGQLILQPDKNNPEIKRPQIARTLSLEDHPDYL